MGIIKGYQKEKFDCRIVSLEEMKTNLQNYDINKILLNDTKLQFTNNGIIVDEILFCDKDVPMTIPDNFFARNGLCIDETYAKEHIEDIKEITLNFCKTTTQTEVTIDSELLIGHQVIEALCQNSNIETIKFGNEEQPFVLTEELYQKMKEAGKKKIKTDAVSEKLTENFDSVIGYNADRRLIGIYRYEDLAKKEDEIFSKPLTDEEILNLKYLNPSCNVSIMFDDFACAQRVVTRLKELGCTGKIDLKIENKNSFNDYLFQNLDSFVNNPNLDIHLEKGERASIGTYIKSEKQLLEMTAPAQHLSPFEKYLYAYNVTKQYKKYKENPLDSDDSRDLYKILNNEYMVCVGYSNLLGDLLDKLGIENQDLGVTVDITEDVKAKKTKEEQENIIFETAGHARRKIHLVDPKYGIDGYYFADPTWDNNLEKDFYTYALLTGDEYSRIFTRDCYMNSGTYEMMFAHNMEEYYERLQRQIDRSYYSGSRQSKANAKASSLHWLMKDFEKLNPSFYQTLVEKYSDLWNYLRGYNMIEEDKLNQVAYEIGEHILEKVNHPVSGNQFKEAITTVYKECYGMKDPDELEQTINGVMQLNAERYRLIFPPVHMIDQNGNEYVDVLENKFEQAMNVEHKTM